jgi:Domain of unknown function (DUF4352)
VPRLLAVSSTPIAGSVALTPAPRRRRFPAVTLIAGLALLAGACGADEEAAQGTAAAAQGGGPNAAVAGAPGARVAGYFGSVTGFPLNVDGDGLFASLSPDRSDPERSNRLSARYGSFNLYVLGEEGSEYLYTRHEGRRVKPDEHGLYWHDMGGSWSAMKPYGNVVLDWIVDERRVDERFHRLDAVLARMDEGADSVRGSLPAEERADADGRIITTVGRAEQLEVRGLRVRLTRVETGPTVAPPDERGLTAHAQGIFVVAQVSLENDGDRPVTSLSGVKLQVGERTYDQDFGASYTLTGPRAFPLQPGEQGEAGVVFDVPPAAAAEAMTSGVLAFPGDEELTSVEYAAQIGVIRLGASGSGQGQAS